MKKLIVGLIEKVKIIGKKKSVATLAKFDTGAAGNSIDIRLAAKVGLLVVSTTKVMNASIKDFKRRPVVEVIIKIKGRKFNTRANIEDRSHLPYPVLIGRKLILSNFVVDIARTNKTHVDIDLRAKTRKKHKKLVKELKLNG